MAYAAQEQATMATRIMEHPELCVLGSGHGGFRYSSAWKRCSTMIVSWLRAAAILLLPSFSKSRFARQINFVTASSVGDEPRILIDLWMTRLGLSMAFVV